MCNTSILKVKYFPECLYKYFEIQKQFMNISNIRLLQGFNQGVENSKVFNEHQYLIISQFVVSFTIKSKLECRGASASPHSRIGLLNMVKSC